MTLLWVDQLVKSFNLGSGQLVRAVDNVSFRIEPGRVVGLVGESGSGKSTLGRLLVGLERKTSGTIGFDGDILPDRYSRTDFKRQSQRVQMIFQDPYASLNPRMTVEEILSEPLRLQGNIGRSEMRTRCLHWLKTVNLGSDCLSRYPHEFSGGQRQRIGIARALINEPRFVVCDEPVSALDVSVQAQVVNLLRELQQQTGVTLLFIAHDLSMVRFLCDEVLVMYLGRIVEQASSQQLFSEPMHPYTRGLLAANPLPDPRAERQRQSAAVPGDTSMAPESSTGCLFAPRCAHVSERCRQQQPPLHQVGQTRVACWLYPED